MKTNSQEMQENQQSVWLFELMPPSCFDSESVLILIKPAVLTAPHNLASSSVCTFALGEVKVAVIAAKKKQFPHCVRDYPPTIFILSAGQLNNLLHRAV